MLSLHALAVERCLVDAFYTLSTPVKSVIYINSDKDARRAEKFCYTGKQACTLLIGKELCKKKECSRWRH
jgi:hypothetical protein